MSADPLAQALHATPYPQEAFHFLERGLAFAANRVHGESKDGEPEKNRHISGAQLSDGLRHYAISEYVLLARFMLARWHITRTRDFGEMVFALIEGGRLRKTEEDSLSDFDSVFDFASAFPDELTFSPLPADNASHD